MWNARKQQPEFLNRANWHKDRLSIAPFNKAAIEKFKNRKFFTVQEFLQLPEDLLK